jgi:hypothetical protein
VTFKIFFVSVRFYFIIHKIIFRNNFDFLNKEGKPGGKTLEQDSGPQARVPCATARRRD